ncbi:hypothetical protein BHE74_00046394 [Ensete ventricosum]|nr:hypothetical protein BHE74_00046394 [Ensete ventricosum]
MAPIGTATVGDDGVLSLPPHPTAWSRLISEESYTRQSSSCFTVVVSASTSSGTSMATLPACRAVSSSLHICADSSLQHLLLLWLPADLPQLTICVHALSASTPSLFGSSFNPTPLAVSKTAHTSTLLHLSSLASRPTS